jgi:hypothetical protein
MLVMIITITMELSVGMDRKIKDLAYITTWRRARDAAQ